VHCSCTIAISVLQQQERVCLLLYILCVGVCVCVFSIVEVVGIVCIHVCRELCCVEGDHRGKEEAFKKVGGPVRKAGTLREEQR